MAYPPSGSVSQPRDQAAWNINAAAAMHVSELWKKATRHYLSGDFDGWFWHLTALRENINHDLTDGLGKHKTNERKELDDMEKSVSRARNDWKISHSITAKNIYALEVRKYSRRLGDLLKQLGYLPPKEDRTKLGF